MMTILVATDYSDAATNALQYAARLATVVEADLVLFNAYHLSGHARNALVMPTGVDEMIRINEGRLQRLARETAREFSLKVSSINKLE